MEVHVVLGTRIILLQKIIEDDKSDAKNKESIVTHELFRKKSNEGGHEYLPHYFRKIQRNNSEFRKTQFVTRRNFAFCTPCSPWSTVNNFDDVDLILRRLLKSLKNSIKGSTLIKNLSNL